MAEILCTKIHHKDVKRDFKSKLDRWITSMSKLVDGEFRRRVRLM